MVIQVDFSSSLKTFYVSEKIDFQLFSFAAFPAVALKSDRSRRGLLKFEKCSQASANEIMLRWNAYAGNIFF